MTYAIGSLFTGYGGLDQGVTAAIGGRVAWHSEIAAGPCRILEARRPGIPNLGDISSIRWEDVAPVDVLVGGFPCQDVSTAGLRAGLVVGTRSGLWHEFATAIERLRPGMVVIENVRGLLSADAIGNMEPDPWNVGNGPGRPLINAFGTVLGNMADLGYDAEWTCVRAADAGAPHGRPRVFVIAYPRHDGRGRGAERDDDETIADRAWRADANGSLRHADGAARGERRRATPRETEVFDLVGERRTVSARYRPPRDADRPGLEGWTVSSQRPGERDPRADDLGTRARATPDAVGGESERWGGPRLVGGAASSNQGDAEQRERVRDAARDRGDAIAWGRYEPAIRRWERILGRPAPAPTLGDGRDGRHRLSARFTEWLMGLDDGYVTRVDGLSRNEQFKALGNGVVPQQARLALEILDAPRRLESAPRVGLEVVSR